MKMLVNIRCFIHQVLLACGSPSVSSRSEELSLNVAYDRTWRSELMGEFLKVETKLSSNVVQIFS